MRCEHRNNAPTSTAVGLHHTGALNNWGKMKISNIRHLKRMNAKVGWRWILVYFLPFIQDFWTTYAFPEQQSCSEIFHCIEIFFIIQDFWANCACPEIFQGGVAAALPASHAYAPENNSLKTTLTPNLATAIRYLIYKQSTFLRQKVVRTLPNATVL